jgi:hypothetical protein
MQGPLLLLAVTAMTAPTACFTSSSIALTQLHVATPDTELRCTAPQQLQPITAALTHCFLLSDWYCFIRQSHYAQNLY